MTPEFPVDRWLRKHATPWRTVGAMAALIMFISYATAHFPTIYFAITLYGFMAFAVAITIWGLVWNSKYLYKPEFCKECGKAKDRQYED